MRSLFAHLWLVFQSCLLLHLHANRIMEMHVKARISELKETLKKTKRQNKKKSYRRILPLIPPYFTRVNEVVLVMIRTGRYVEANQVKIF